MILSDASFADDIRQLAATCISQNLDIYNEAFLGKSNQEYCQWLRDKQHWGGKIVKDIPQTGRSPRGKSEILNVNEKFNSKYLI